MSAWFDRTVQLLGKEAFEKLQNAHVLVIGLGGVGSNAAEHLVRSGIGNLTIVDSDVVQISNINRQLQALHSTVGEKKAQVLAKRLQDINPQLNITVEDRFIDETEIVHILGMANYDYVVDAIDTLTPKVLLLYHALRRGFRIVSSMGTGGKLNPTMVRIADISETYGDKFARQLRKKLHKLGIYAGIKSVFSPEPTNPEALIFVNERNKKTTLGTISFIPAIFGLYCAYTVVNDLIQD